MCGRFALDIEKPPQEDNHKAIQVTGLTKKYNGFTAVDNISFSVDRGDIFAFLGPNGAGKTTTIKMLTTLLLPTAGTMKLENIDPVTQQHEARKIFGIVFQDPSLDDELTAYENLEFHGLLYKVERELRIKRIRELLALVELTDKRNNLVKTFSGGMKRRLEIARGLLHHPRIFFLDEPTLGLDPQTRNKIWLYLKNLNREEGITVFFTTHYMEEAAKVAHHLAVIDHGKILAQGTSEKLMSQTKTGNLEDAFLALTGDAIREEKADSFDRMRQRMRSRNR